MYKITDNIVWKITEESDDIKIVSCWLKNEPQERMYCRVSALSYPNGRYNRHTCGKTPGRFDLLRDQLHSLFKWLQDENN